VPPPEVRREDAGRLLTLEQAQGIALGNHPGLAFAAARVAAARGQWVQAGLGPNPEIGYMGDEIGNEGRRGMHGGFVSKEFVTGRKLQLSREVAARDIALAEQRVAALRWRVLSDVRIAFYEALISQRRVETSSQLLATAQRGVKTAELLIKAKDVGTPDLLRAQIEFEQARIELSRAEQQLLAAWRTLSAVMGTPQMAMPMLEGDPASQPCHYEWEPTLGRLLSESPEMGAALLRAERARWALSRARAEPIPNVTLEGSVQYDDATRDTFAGVKASIPVPLFNRNQGAIFAAESELRAAERDIDRVGLWLQQRLAAVFSQYAVAQHESTTYRDAILGKAETTLNLIEKGYRAGEFNSTDVLTAQRTYFQANISYLNALRELRAAEARIEGLLLSGSLEDQAATTP
jgi:cobalt-zinc-cadmium efflux system outer membrane protein